jgi:hypothetical protein
MVKSWVQMEGTCFSSGMLSHKVHGLMDIEELCGIKQLQNKMLMKMNH